MRDAQRGPDPTPGHGLDVRGEEGGRIVLTLPEPPSVNGYWRHFAYRDKATGRLMVAKDTGTDGKRFRKAVRELCVAQQLEPLAGPVEVWLVWWHGPAAGDVDNRVKPTFDALKGLAFHDDRQVVRYHAEKRRGDRPRMEVEIRRADHAPLFGADA